jgi:hypothetical protein
MSQVAVQLHKCHELNGVSRLQRALILVEATHVACNIHDQLSTRRDKLEVSISDVR